VPPAVLAGRHRLGSVGRPAPAGRSVGHPG